MANGIHPESEVQAFDIDADADNLSFDLDRVFEPDCSKEQLITRLTQASQFRLLNPAFLMGDRAAPPFVVSIDELASFLADDAAVLVTPACSSLHVPDEVNLAQSMPFDGCHVKGNNRD